MSLFDSREQAYENRFVYEETQEFRMRARRNKLLGLWMAKTINLDEVEAQVFADKFAEDQVGTTPYTAEKSDRHLVGIVLETLSRYNVYISEREVRKSMENFMDMARHHILTASPVIF